MENDNKNSLIKKADSLLKFAPQKKKDLIIRGLKEIGIGKEPNQLKDAEKKTILLVDFDIPVHRLIDEEFPFKDKIDLVHFYSPMDAINYLLTNKVHLIISCILYPDPDINGILFLRVCKELNPKLPFIIHSGMDPRDDFAVWASDAYIIKSSDLSELFKTVGNLLDDKFYINTEELNSEIKSVYGNLGMHRAAIWVCKQEIKMQPNNKAAYERLGFIYETIGMYKEAIEEYKQVIRIEPDFSVYCRLGISYYRLGMYIEAVEAYKQAITIQSNYDYYIRPGFNRFISCMKKLSMNREFIEAHREAIRIRPNFADAYYGLGVAYLYSGQKGKALELYQKLKKINPKLAEELFKQIYKF